MSPIFQEILTVSVFCLLGVMSPGPDFIMISRNSLVYSRRVGVMSSIGLGLGVLVHSTYSIVGIGYIIANSLLLYTALKFLGGAYLIYIGYKSLKAKGGSSEPSNIGQPQTMGDLQALRVGFLTNVLNPKCSLFFFALFTQVISPGTPLQLQLIYCFINLALTFLWFTLVALLFSAQAIRARVNAFQFYLEKVFGVLLVALGIKVALTAKD